MSAKYTSPDAARTIKKVLGLIEKRGPILTRELEKAMNMGQSTLTGYTSHLRRLGAIRKVKAASCNVFAWELGRDASLDGKPLQASSSGERVVRKVNARDVVAPAQNDPLMAALYGRGGAG